MKILPSLLHNVQCNDTSQCSGYWYVTFFVLMVKRLHYSKGIRYDSLSAIFEKRSIPSEESEEFSLPLFSPSLFE